VELLVVIGIIALLIAMLMPALTRVRQQGLSLKCKAQMRDVGLQLRMYSDEYTIIRTTRRSRSRRCR